MNCVDVMLDLETLSTDTNAVLTQVSAVPFSFKQGLLDFTPFNALINPVSSVKYGLKINGETVEWWLKQEPSVIQKVFVSSIQNGVDLKEALAAFSQYVEDLKKQFNAKQVCLWGNGVKADNVWIESAYKAVGLKYPVTFRDDMDMRTLVRLGKEFDIDLKDKIPFEGDKHNAIDDCKHQIKVVCTIYNNLKQLTIPK